VTFDEDLLVFIDETGHELIPKAAPYFGLGGIIIYGADYARAIESPWEVLRTSMGLRPGQPLHAATDFSVYAKHLDEMQKFFAFGDFFRHVAIATDRTKSNTNPFITASCGGLIRNVGRALLKTIQKRPVSRVVYVLEHSQRLHSTYEKLVGPSGPTLVSSDGTRLQFPHVWSAIRKASCIPGLEVSDFVLHAAQGQVAARLKRPTAPVRKDFHAVFQIVNPHYVEYMEINEAETTESEGPPGVFRIGLL
jgi:hypothetical protein